MISHKLLLPLIFIMLFNCNNGSDGTNNSDKKDINFEVGSTPLETLKRHYITYGGNQPDFYLDVAYMRKYKDEILNSLKVVDTISYTNEDNEKITATFVSYFIKTEVNRDVFYFKEYDGKFYMTFQYPSTYSDSGEEKKIAQKVDDWKTKIIYRLNY